jgi:hypothetical protein
MAAQSVNGASPVTFISEDTTTQNAGTQYQIPLPLISYNTSLSSPAGPVDLSGWPQHATIASSDLLLAQAVVQNLINQGLLSLKS